VVKSPYLRLMLSVDWKFLARFALLSVYLTESVQVVWLLFVTVQLVVQL
jgi:hypothetical protein